MPRPGRIPQTNRGSVKVAAKQTSAPLTFPAPTQGLVTTSSMGAAAPGSAAILENWFMTLKGARVRGGSVKRGIAADGGTIRSAFKYKFGGLEKMFMATDTAIYDMTAPPPPSSVSVDGDFTNPAEYSLARASTGTYFGSDGLLKTAANDVARFEYNPLTAEIIGLLIEPQRTNLLTRSNEFENAAWGKFNVTVTANAGDASDGTLTADKIIPTATNAFHYVDSPPGVFAVGELATGSVTLQSAGYTQAQIYLTDPAGIVPNSTLGIDLNTGSIIAGNGSVTALPGGRFRVAVTSAITSAGNARLRVIVYNNGGGVFSGDGVSGILASHAQLEKGNVGSSYIPTTTAAVTRSPDSLTLVNSGLNTWDITFSDGSVQQFAGITGNLVLISSNLTGKYVVHYKAILTSFVSAAVSGMSSGDWCAFQQTNAGTSYLVCFNGANDRRLFNGVSWSTSPAITFSDSTTMSALNFGWMFKNRQFLLKNGSLDAYYLGLNAVGGAASVFPLGGVMKKGGQLLMGFSWSIESGDGLGDYCVFVSTEGEVAIYSGSDPSNANDFALKGVYQIGKPLGKNAQIRSGADVLVATIDGLIPISQMFQRDRQTLALVSLSRAIEDEWKLAANATPAGWTMTLWPEQNLVFIAFPENLVLPDTTFVLNVLNGKWSIVKNWRAQAYQSLQGSLFFGSNAGLCWQGDISGADNGAPFAATYLSQFTAAGEFAQAKTASKAAMSFRAKTRPNVKLFARADYDKRIPAYAVVSVGDAGSSEWDVGLWDVAKWDGVTEFRNFKFRQNVRANGEMLAVGCVVLSGGQFRLDVEVDFAILQMEGGEQSA